MIFAEVEPKLSKITVDRDYNLDYVRYDFIIAEKFKMYISLDLKYTSKEIFKIGDWPHELKNLTDSMKNHGHVLFTID